MGRELGIDKERESVAEREGGGRGREKERRRKVEEGGTRAEGGGGRKQEAGEWEDGRTRGREDERIGGGRQEWEGG